MSYGLAIDILFDKTKVIMAINDYRAYLVLLAVAVAVLGHVWRTLSSPLAKVPGPFYSNFTGLVLKVYWLAGKRATYVHDLHKKYGPIVRVRPGEVDIMDIPAVKEIHTVKATYIKDPKLYGNFAAPGQESVFSTVDVEFHRRHRRLLSGAFSETSLKAMHPIVKDRVDLTIQRMAEEMNSRGCADVFKWWQFVRNLISSPQPRRWKHALTLAYRWRPTSLGSCPLASPSVCSSGER